jgi:hypothetical protein
MIPFLEKILGSEAYLVNFLFEDSVGNIGFVDEI